MRAIRYSIARILLVIVLCGVVFAAVRSPSPMWANVLYSVVCVAVVLAGIQVVYSRGWARAFWAGFLIAGGSYFAVYSIPGLREAMCPRLIAEPLIDLLYDNVARAPASTQPGPGSAQRSFTSFVNTSPVSSSTLTWVAPSGSPPGTSRWSLWTQPDFSSGVGYPVGGISLASSEPFRQIGHSILILVFAVCGGMFARHRQAAGTAIAPPPA